MNKHRDIRIHTRFHLKSYVVWFGKSRKACFVRFPSSVRYARLTCQIYTYIGNNLRANSAYFEQKTLNVYMFKALTLIGSFAFRKKENQTLLRLKMKEE